MLGLARYVVHGAGGGGNAPSLNFNFVDGSAFPSAITFSRASSATMFDSSGNLVYAPMNAIRNNTMVGAVAGTPGTAPTNWAVTTTGGSITRTIVGTGTENGIAYIDIQYVFSAGATATVQFEQGTQIAAANGQTWTQSTYVKLAGGSLTNISEVRNSIAENNAGGTFLAGSTTAFTPTTGALSGQRYTHTRTLNNASTAFVVGTTQIVATGAADITLRIGMPQLELGSVAREVIATSGTAYQGPRLDYDPATLLALGLLIEEQRTNSIRNNTMQGALAGTPGTAPTNWTVTSTTNGITREVVGAGIEDGISYVDIRFYGTAIANLNFAIGAETNTQVVASTGQQWTGSLFMRLISGSYANLSAHSLFLNSYTAAGGFDANAATITYTYPAGGATNAALRTQRYVFAGTLNSATTARVNTGFFAAYNAGAVIDITLRIGLPQLELGAFATSVIPTTTTALTRSADVASVNTLSPWFNAAQGTLYAETQLSNTVAQNRAGFDFNDGSTNNRNIFRAFTTGSADQNTIRSGGSTVATLASATTPTTAVRKSVSAYAANDFAFTADGAVPVTDTLGVVPVGLTTFLLGSAVAGTEHLNGYLRRITYYPRRLANAALQQITA